MNLKCLDLDYVTLAEDAFEKLISSCPLLEKLALGVLKWRYQLPSSLFTCGSLSSLKLRNCLLRPPSSFVGFKNLKYLNLEHFTLTNDAFEKLISSCPLLETLTLIEYNGADYSFNVLYEANYSLNVLNEADNLKINAPNLQSIYIVGGFVSITFEYAMTNLSLIYIDAPQCAYASLLGFFIKLPHIQRLELKGCDMRFMSGGSIVKGFPFKCKDLYHLAISMDFSLDDDEATLYIYRSSSNLTERHKEALDNCYLAIEVGVWEDNDSCHHEFRQLRWAQMDNFCGTRAELEFVKFVLGNSPVLEEMTVNPHSDDISWKYIKRIYGFKRASEVEIIFDSV